MSAIKGEEVMGPVFPPDLYDRLPDEFRAVVLEKHGANGRKAMLVITALMTAAYIQGAPLWRSGEPGTYSNRGFAIECALVVAMNASTPEEAEGSRALAKDILEWAMKSDDDTGSRLVSVVDNMVIETIKSQGDGGMVN
ncbi:MAG: hypothetical protein KAI64_00785 [Thermoplasmata archaeon]|jgi:hypothetical protein|nr:hypothetical protein [Thermoplasmata archaeon]